ncbi:hypothetical protein QOM21_33135 [Streptomyces sp. Pv4-95]|uniref:hypothetical protein n=1 Tax=Streptomyces sp. Pv4-95 TaxID=3049543 RepID=UPI003891915C
MTPDEAAASELLDRAALWSTGDLRAAEVVAAACDALVAGWDGPGLRALAACTRGEADHDVPDLLPEALADLGLTFSAVAGANGREAAARALARRTLAGDLTPREFTFWVHQRCGHELALTERLAELDDEYDLLGFERRSDRTSALLDAEVVSEARRLVARHHVPADAGDGLN